VTDPDCQETRPGFLFSDRAWPFKLGIAIALFAALCGRAHREIGGLHPEIESGAVAIENVRGKTIHAWALPILGATGDGFDVETKVGPFHVTWPSPAPAPGQYVTLTGTIVEPRHVVASAIRVNTGYRWKRGLNYGLSSATVLAFLWIVRRRFRWRLSEGLLRGRY
jgi:hypothetical protein